MFSPLSFSDGSRRTWQVGELLQACSDLLNARLNPVTVCGEIVGFSLASSGHCYFTLKEVRASQAVNASQTRLNAPLFGAAQLRCAMFKRALGLLPTVPKNGDVVELRGRLEIYAARGEFQLIAESLQFSTHDTGHWFEQFLHLKTKLEAAGFFDPARKRPLPTQPLAIGVVTSLQAAALHDVCAALRRRVPHLPVLIAPASVQGGAAAQELAQALDSLYARREIGVILLVRGGGSAEDLIVFNDEALAHKILQSPVPVVAGIGHETDFTIADFCADVRAPTPTAAAELCAQPLDELQKTRDELAHRLSLAVQDYFDGQAQSLDQALAQFGRLRASVHIQNVRLNALDQRLQRSIVVLVGHQTNQLHRLQERLPTYAEQALDAQRHKMQLVTKRLDLLSPQRVLDRGYAWVSDIESAHLIDAAIQVVAGQALKVRVARGAFTVRVSGQLAR
jgi:exodeoxyribonuclease VII large subunit